jgi:ubiquinone/menaquinone biosynthesis C-methylase UbiE
VRPHEHDVERFSEWAPSYDRHWMQRLLFTPVQRVVLDLAATEVPSPKALLDVGCGTGRLLRAAYYRFPSARAEGVDAAKGMVLEARRAAEDTPVHFQQAVAEALPFPDASFDLVMSTLTFHHWSDQPRAIAEVARVLRPGGRWVIADFMASGPAAVITRLLGAHQFPARDVFDAMLAGSRLRVVARRSVWRTLGNISVLAIAGQA